MKQNRGVSLIVLVVTIIVMIIIAGAVIITLNNTNIIDQGESAVKKHNEKSIKEAIDLEYKEALAAGLGKIDVQKFMQKLEDLRKIYPEIQNIRAEEGKVYYTLSLTGNEYSIIVDNNTVIEEKDPYERVVGEASLWKVSGTRITGYNGTGEQLKDVTVPNVVVDENGNETTIESVYIYAPKFEGTLTIASNLTIETGCFASNTNHKIEKLIMGDNITIAENSNSFKGCTNLKEVEIGKNVRIKNHTSYSHFLNNCTLLESMTVKSVSEVGDYAFYGIKTGLKGTITINEGVISIGKYTFRGCENVENIVLPNSVEEIGEYAFKDCKKAKINYPESIISVGKSSFYNCENMIVDLKIKEGTTLGETAFQYSGIKTLEVGDGILLPYGSFVSCKNLEEVVIKDNVQIKDSFATCTNLKEVSMGKNISMLTCGMYQHSFYSCKSLENVTIESLSEVGEEALRGIGKALKGTITINEGVTSIGARAFYGCGNAQAIVLPSTITSIGGNAFGTCKGLKTLSINMTEEEFANVTKGTSWQGDVPTDVIKYLK